MDGPRGLSSREVVIDRREHVAQLIHAAVDIADGVDTYVIGQLGFALLPRPRFEHRFRFTLPLRDLVLSPSFMEGDPAE